MEKGEEKSWEKERVSEKNEEKVIDIQSIKLKLAEIQTILQKRELWPYQKLNLEDFRRKFFPKFAETEVKNYFNLSPEELIAAIENKLKATDALLRPFEEKKQALELQKGLLDFFSIFLPDKLGQCQNILYKTPMEIKNDFLSKSNLKLATKHGFTPEKVSELIASWQNLRYMGGGSEALSPLSLCSFLGSPQFLEEKRASLSNAVEQISPGMEKISKDYELWAFVKEKIDEEKKVMTFGPTSIKKILESLNSTYRLSLNGKITKEQSLDVINQVENILFQVTTLDQEKDKRLLTDKDRENIGNLIKRIQEKQELFFYIAEISSVFKKGEELAPTQKETLQIIIRIIDLLPNNTEEAKQLEEIKETFGIVYEPLGTLLEADDLPVSSKMGLELLKQVNDKIAWWIVNRIAEEKKPGLENILEIFNGIPPLLGLSVAKLIKSERVKINLEKLKACLTKHFSKSGIFELYKELIEEKGDELTVSDELIIPRKDPQMGLPPIFKQIKFKFMSLLETTIYNNRPLFNVLEANKIVPNNIIELFLTATEEILIKIIESRRKLHELIGVDENEYEVQLLTITRKTESGKTKEITSLKLTPLMNSFFDAFLKIIQELEQTQLGEEALLFQFKNVIEKIWMDSLVIKKKIEPQEEIEVSSSRVSAMTAMLEGGKPPAGPGGPPIGPLKGPPSGPPVGPPTGPPKGLPSGPPVGPPTGPPKGPTTGPPSEFPPVPPKEPKIIDEKEKARIESIRKTISEAEALLKTYIEKPEQIPKSELVMAFKLLAKIHNLNIEVADPVEIQEIMQILEALRLKSEIFPNLERIL